jgi:hypothetical protein
MMRNAGLAVGLLVLTSSLALAQQPPAGGAAGGQRAGGAAPPMTNLLVIPKETPREQVLATMQQFTQALGVQCNYCHVQEGRGGRNDFASDEKQPKKAARGMMMLARDINGKLPMAVGKPDGAAVRVGCATCHRGVPIPKQLADIVAEASASGGASAGLAKYKELREKFYGGQSYDFSEASLVVIAQRANTAGKADDALAYLNGNLEYFPKSSRTYQAIGAVKNSQGDKAGAVAALQKAIELDPANAQAKTQLENLKK